MACNYILVLDFILTHADTKINVILKIYQNLEMVVAWISAVVHVYQSRMQRVVGICKISSLGNTSNAINQVTEILRILDTLVLEMHNFNRWL